MPKSNNLPRAGIVIAIILAISFLYVWQRIQIFRLGYKIRIAEKNLDRLQEENTVFGLQISTLVSPQNIKREVEKLGLNLRPPKEKQVIRVR